MADRLPIYEIEQQLVASLQDKRRLIISAPTGSGKSTQVPQMLLRHGLLGDGQVVILQPRRLAARLLAKRLAEELGAPLGREVGYSIRFENVSSANTRIRFVTEGVLLRQMLEDPLLTGVTALIFDEFHERHLYGDITLARALDLQAKSRPDLRLLVMSATLDLDLLRDYLGARGTGSLCGELVSEGRLFPVDIEYTAKPSYLDQRPIGEQAADAFARCVRAGDTGDVLVFMPGSFEIAQTLEAIRQRPESRGFVLLPLHGELPPRDQDAAVARYGQPKVVVATNVAETSLTIDGIRLVIDSGLARIPRYDPYRGINTLLVEPISRASAEQRAGRAGRTTPGRCVRLWSAAEHAQRPERELPEIKRLDLAEVVLTLKAAGVEDLRQFRWLEPPDERALARAEELLMDLGALKAEAATEQSAATVSPAGPGEKPRSGTAPGIETAAALQANGSAQTGDGNKRRGVASHPEADVAGAAVHPPGSAPRRPPLRITPLGRKMLAFPVHPRYARMLVAAQDNGCVYQACLVAALTQGRDLLLRNVDKATSDLREGLLGDRTTSDLGILMRAWNYARQHDYRPEACRRLGIHAVTARQVAPLFEQFLRIAEREGLDVRPGRVNEAALQQCILAGFSDHLARRVDSGTLRCELVHGRRGVLARESAVQQAALFVAAEVREVEARDKTVTTLLTLATAVEPAWLHKLFPEDISTGRRVFFDATARRVYAEEEVRFRDLPLETRRIEPPPEAAARLLAGEIVAGRLPLKSWDHGVEQWILRLNLLAQWCPELGLPAFTTEAKRHVVEQLCHGACSYREVKERPVQPLVRAWLSEGQQALLDQHAPERLELTNGRRPRVLYSPDAPPHVALRIQELYGVTRTPRIALGRVPVVVRILSPGMKPVQVTQDLANFWREHYPKLKQELQRKYPKHEWR